MAISCHERHVGVQGQLGHDRTARATCRDVHHRLAPGRAVRLRRAVPGGDPLHQSVPALPTSIWPTAMSNARPSTPASGSAR